MNLVLLFYILISFLFSSEGEKFGLGGNARGRRKSDDEPRLVSWKVLEGITEPFETSQQSAIPIWKQMKSSADQKAANLAIQQALHEYGQILRHPYVFSDMPTEERYDIFISMAKLLKIMGFYQRAELLLYEAMAHTNNPFEAHFQLGLLNLDKENIDYAKLHFKNCLFLSENDLLVLINLSVILLMENKLNESKYFLTRVLAQLEDKLRKLSFILSEQDIQRIKTPIDYKLLTSWIEELIVKVLYGEFRVAPLATVELLSYFWNLYHWISIGEMNGRYLFDLGQSLYENGKPLIGQKMMMQGYETADLVTEGAVSAEIVKLRLALDYPIVSESIPEIVIAYFNMTTFLSNTANNYSVMNIENLMDIYWPIPLLAWSGLPMTPVIKELLWRFQHTHEDSLAAAYSMTNENNVSPEWRMKKDYFLSVTNHESVYAYYMQWKEQFQILHCMELETFHTRVSPPLPASAISATQSSSKNICRELNKEPTGKENTVVQPVSPPLIAEDFSSSWLYDHTKIEIGIFGGHMNNHPIGQMILHRLLSLVDSMTSNSNPFAPPSASTTSVKKWKHLFSWTLLSLPLVPDEVTKEIAKKVHRIVNIPIDNFNSAKEILQTLTLDIVIFPDYAPFPDQQALLFQSMRIAPVQICLFVRGTSCITDTIDYYLLPKELEAFFEGTVKASASNAIWNISIPANSPHGNLGIAATGGNLLTGSTMKRKLRKYLRPAWKEHFVEQVVLIDWPIITSSSVQSMMTLLENTHANINDGGKTNNHGQGNSHDAFPFGNEGNSGKGTGSSGYNGRGGSTGKATNDYSTVSTASASSTPATSTMMLEDMFFTSFEHEGKIFFENQPVALLPIYPYNLHPLMDEVIFKIMRALPTLQVILAIPESFLTHLKQEKKHKLSWAKKLVRRLWSKGGNLHHRIRLLPSPLEDNRILQLLRQSDIVLDTFPFGNAAYFLSMALSVGTPIVTLQSGHRIQTPKEDYEEIRSVLMYNQHALVQYKDHPLRHVLMNHPYPTTSPAPQNRDNATVKNTQSILFDEELPWTRSLNNIEGYYLRTKNSNFSTHLIAKNLSHYFTLATNLLSKREFAYDIRVQLLDAIDLSSSTTPSKLDQASPSLEEDDLYRFLYRIGMPWAHTRILQSDEYHQYLESQKLRKQQKKESFGRSKNSKRDGKAKGRSTDFQDFIRKTMAGTIYV